MASALLALFILAIIARGVEQHGPIMLIPFGLVAVAYVFARGMWRTTGNIIEKHGWGTLLWRFVSGNYLVHPSHFRRPKKRLHHAAIRVGVTFGSVISVVGLMFYRVQTVGGYLVILALLGTFAAWKLRNVWGAWRDHRKFTHPLHLRLARLLAIEAPRHARDWVKVDPGREQVTVSLPPEFDPSDAKMCKAIENCVVTSLALDSPDVTWFKAAREPRVVFSMSTPPPGMVDAKTAMPAIKACGEDELYLATARKNEALTFSLHGDSPHVGASIGSGGGKSVLGRLLGAQILYHGGLVFVLDVKQSSHPWARNLPNVWYARNIEQIHDALCILGAELDRRNELAWDNMDDEGNITVDVGPRILTIFEEINSTIPDLKRYWKSIKAKDDPAESPALVAWGKLSCMGRQAKMHLMVIAQMLTAKAAGSGEIRENLGVRILGRYTWQNWKMLVAGEYPMPTMNPHPGRVQVVLRGVKEGQVAFLTGKEARTLATSGTVATFSTATRQLVTVPAVPAIVDGNNALDQQHVPGTPHAVSLGEAVTGGLFGGLSYDAAKKRLQRASVSPLPVGKRGNEHLYDEIELKDWIEHHA